MVLYVLLIYNTPFLIRYRDHICTTITDKCPAPIGQNYDPLTV